MGRAGLPHPDKIIPCLLMNQTTKRSLFRWIHILFAMPVFGYIYGPPEETLQYLPYFRFVYFPVVVLSGLLMWKGEALRRLISRNRPDTTPQ